jgi:hypothetical protein
LILIISQDWKLFSLYPHGIFKQAATPEAMTAHINMHEQERVPREAESLTLSEKGDEAPAREISVETIIGALSEGGERSSTETFAKGKDDVVPEEDINPSEAAVQEMEGIEDLKGMRSLLFPQKLMIMIKWCAKKTWTEDQKNPLPWRQDGTSFAVANPGYLIKVVIPFLLNKEINVDSFRRRLYRWGFRQLRKDVFSCAMFLRDDPQLCTRMKIRYSSKERDFLEQKRLNTRTRKALLPRYRNETVSLARTLEEAQVHATAQEAQVQSQSLARLSEAAPSATAEDTATRLTRTQEEGQVHARNLEAQMQAQARANAHLTQHHRTIASRAAMDAAHALTAFRNQGPAGVACALDDAARAGIQLQLQEISQAAAMQESQAAAMSLFLSNGSQPWNPLFGQVLTGPTRLASTRQHSHNGQTLNLDHLLPARVLNQSAVRLVANRALARALLALESQQLPRTHQLVVLLLRLIAARSSSFPPLSLRRTK